MTGDVGQILDFTTHIGPNGLKVDGGGSNTFTMSFDPSAEGTREATLTLLEGLLDGTLGDTIALVDEAGNTVMGIDLSGTGTATDPLLQPGTKGCTIVGTRNGEVLTGTRARDVMCALVGADRVSHRAGNDLVKGAGSDTVRTSKGTDVLKGGSGNDRMTDKAGKDRLYGQGGKDTLNTRDRVRGDLLVDSPVRDKAIKDRRDTAKSIKAPPEKLESTQRVEPGLSIGPGSLSGWSPKEPEMIRDSSDPVAAKKVVSSPDGGVPLMHRAW